MSSLHKDEFVDAANGRLMQALQFSDKDLEANRSGLLTESQRSGIRRKQRSISTIYSVTAIGLSLPLFIVPTTPDWMTGSSSGIYFVILIACTALVLGFLRAAFLAYRRTQQHLANNQSTSIEGVLRCSRSVSQGKSSQQVYQVIVKNRTLTVTKEAYKAFVDGEYYILYCVPDMDYLLTAEYVRYKNV